MISFSPENIKAAKNQLNSPKKILILSHFNPDGDALGSSLGLSIWLEKKGHTTKCIYPSGYPSYYNWMPNIDRSIIYSKETAAQIEDYFKWAELIICTDFNTSNRINDLTPFLENAKVPKLVIDHHENPVFEDFDIHFIEPKASSACEVVYDFIHNLKGEVEIDDKIGTCLYTGLITDTGGFQFSSTNPSTHSMASHLISLGVDSQKIFDYCFNNFSLTRLKLFGYCVANCMKQIPEKKLAYIWIDGSVKYKFNIKDGDTEGLVNHPLKVSDILISALFKEEKDKIRISFRSKGSIDVNQFARKYFNGGGHINAAGGSSKLGLKETLDYFEKAIIEHQFEGA